MAMAAEAVGMGVFDADTFLGKITAVRVESENQLVFLHSDGKESVKRWSDRSRADSWTEDMKAAARHREQERRKNHG